VSLTVVLVMWSSDMPEASAKGNYVSPARARWSVSHLVPAVCTKERHTTHMNCFLAAMLLNRVWTVFQGTIVCVFACFLVQCTLSVSLCYFCGRRCVQGAVGGTCLVALVFVVLCIACRKLATSLALFMGPLAAEQQRTYHFPFYVAASHRHSGCSLCATHY
jgi:hypothetical protein